MGRGLSGPDAHAGANDELPEHTVSVASFALDTFEVTVSRFRKFAAAFDGTPPKPGAGAHPLIANSGWQAAWDVDLAATQAALLANLKCNATNETWTDAAGANESAAINCVSWFEAVAFCVWDGGRMPTEAEWEYAAAGGQENRLYPWGSQDPAVTTTLANFLGSDDDPFLPVGSHPSGKARWGHRDLAGGMFEWNLDWYDAAWYGGGGAGCKNCANISGSAYRVVRGGSWLTGPEALRSAARLEAAPSDRSYNLGFRCAR
jgi:formylglycine-generating enzyme required for sulfatase activity